MIFILSFNVRALYIPAIPNQTMETTRRPHMLVTAFFERGEFFPLKIEGKEGSQISRQLFWALVLIGVLMIIWNIP
jgi:hypothetical protein